MMIYLTYMRLCLPYLIHFVLQVCEIKRSCYTLSLSLTALMLRAVGVGYAAQKLSSHSTPHMHMCSQKFRQLA